jgi:hypothetical protein
MTGLGFFWLTEVEVEGAEFVGAEVTGAELVEAGLAEVGADLVEVGFAASTEVWLACTTLAPVGAVFDPEADAEWGALELTAVPAAFVEATGADCTAA